MVHLCVNKDTGFKFAAKIIDTKKLSEKVFKSIEKEVRICRKLQHPNIVRLHDSIQGMVWFKQTFPFTYLSVLDFLESLFHEIDFWTWFLNLIFELDFLSISNLISTACVACKNQVQNRQKIKFKNQVQNSSSKINFAK